MWQTRFGTCIYTSPSGYQVIQNPIYRWLTLGSNTLHTVINRRKPQRPILHYLPALTLMARHIPKECCILGLGGAAIPHWLRSINPNQPISSVEYSEEVIQIAKGFFMAEQISQFTLIHQDAAEFVKQHNIQVEHLIVDLYDAHHFPKTCSTEDFFYHCKQCLSQDGYLAVNLANTKEQWPIVQIIKTLFPSHVIIPIPKCVNIVVIASKTPDKNLMLDHLKATGEIKKISWVQDWGVIGYV